MAEERTKSYSCFSPETGEQLWNRNEENSRHITGIVRAPAKLE